MADTRASAEALPASRDPTPGSGPHRIAVVGGGAAGLELVTQLGNRMGRRRLAAVTLIEEARTHLWKPLLHSVAAGSLDPGDYERSYLAQAHWHGFRYHLGKMIRLDRKERQVHLAAVTDEEGREITPPCAVPYDTLVIAIGSVTNDFGTPGVARYAIPLETPEQAQRFNRRLVNACIRAQTQEAPVRAGQLHIAIIGAGATGTELAAELHQTIREVLAYGLDRVDPERDVRIILIEAADRILPALPVRISKAALQLLRNIEVEVRCGSPVSEVNAAGVRLADGAFIASELVVWAAGIKAPAVLRDLDGLEINSLNQLVVMPSLQTTRDASVFAIGDCAACPRAGYPDPVPPRAQAAHQEAYHLARQLPRLLAGRPLRPFVYRDFGSLISLGKYTTVGSLMGALVGGSVFVEGIFARLMYRSLYVRHEMALYGFVRTILGVLGRAFSRRAEPVVKLH